MDKLQRLQQKTISVEEYKQKMELYMMRASIRESESTTIARFLSGLNLEIRDRVKLLPYQDLNDLVQLCIKVKQQNLRKTSSRRGGSHPNSYPRREFKRGESVPKEKPRETPKSVGKDMLTPPIRAKDVKCFKCYGRGHVQAQCPNQRTLFLRGVDEYSSCDDTPSGKEEEENNERVYPCEGELMIIRITLNNKTSVNLETQRENIFHTRCKVLENICSLIVDNDFCCNCCSARMVEKLNLQLVSHPKPYKLQWINEDGELTVDKQVKVEFSVGNYKDNILCDVVPMEACHILLGRPWQFDRKTMHNDLTNEITFTHNEKIVVFLGFVVNKNGVHVDPEKIKSIREWPTPQNVGDVRSFHGLASFYRRFVPNFSSIASPLNELVKKDTPFCWNEKHEQALKGLKLNSLMHPF
ncbi:uncharacterized protein [Phaseolus vulgaris]|uniref:uncharacterized protein n=1 Tax=Phaseolus vulgaris TaxID=3885 RepID=UPI0035CB8405